MCPTGSFLRAELSLLEASRRAHLVLHLGPLRRQLERFKKYPYLGHTRRDDDFIYMEWNISSNIFLKVA